MELDLKGFDKEEYGKLFVSVNDLNLASYCLKVIVQKKWHHQPWERRQATYQQQATYTTALIVAYGRVFTTSKGWERVSKELKRFDGFTDEESAVHNRMMELRHSVFAHSDSKNYSIRPFRNPELSSDVVREPTLRITAEESVLLNRMIRKLAKTFIERMSEIRKKY
jgi:hypothetical protein